MPEAKKTVEVDGRRARSERSKQAIMDAALALMESGNLIPTAQQISDQAGVGIRSFFRHFDDMDSLFAQIEEQTSADTEKLFLGGDRDGTLPVRILHAVERRGAGYEKRRNMILSTTAQLWRSALLRKNYAHYQRALRKDLDDWLPELKQLSGPQREAVDAIASFEMWQRLRYHQGLGKRATIEVIASTLTGMIKG